MERSLPLELVADEIEQLQGQLCTCKSASLEQEHTSLCAQVRLVHALRASAGAIALAAHFIRPVAEYLENETRETEQASIAGGEEVAAQWRLLLENDRRRIEALHTALSYLSVAVPAVEAE